MRFVRRQLAAGALWLMALQAALVFTAPLASCCVAHASARAEADEECCPAGTHPPGQCPRHARQARSSSAACRLQCDAPHGVQFVTGVAGVLPARASALSAAPSAPTFSSPVALALFRASVPISPPPRLR
jgi:hypothetical protein